MCTMQPVPDEFLSCDAFALSDLCFVMRKNVIDAAAMDIDLITEQRRRHRAAFDMPAGAARPPRRIPFHIAIFFIPCFPKGKVADMFLVILVVLHAPG